jgi:hypothetical protein
MSALKKMSAMVAFLFANSAVMACEVCKKQQPEVLRGITHGAGPQSDWDYVVVWCMVITVMISLFYGVKWILHPGEKESEHIKRSILNLD